MVAPGYGYGIVAMAALGYGGPQSFPYPLTFKALDQHDPFKIS